MVMAVYERTREIGVLRAVGWTRRQVLGMIIFESLGLSIVAALIGTLFGVILTLVIASLPAVAGLIQPHFSVGVFAIAWAVALAVGVFGGAYPAYRAARLTPMEALRYE